jgi:hypothetical protein
MKSQRCSARAEWVRSIAGDVKLKREVAIQRHMEIVAERKLIAAFRLENKGERRINE